jgi:DNA-binding NarL/FixJ family response regulator
LVLLRATPQIETVYQADDGPSALASGPEVPPALVVIDYDTTPDELTTDLRQLNAAWPQARYLVLLDDEQDLRRVQSAGADIALVKGIRATTIIETVESLLNDERPSPLGGRS